MSSFTSNGSVRQAWRPVGIIAGWVSGTLGLASLAAAVVLGGATAAVQLAGAGVADAVGAWMMVAQLFIAGALLAAVAAACFSASEGSIGESLSRRRSARAR